MKTASTSWVRWASWTLPIVAAITGTSWIAAAYVGSRTAAAVAILASVIWGLIVSQGDFWHAEILPCFGVYRRWQGGEWTRIEIISGPVAYGFWLRGHRVERFTTETPKWGTVYGAPTRWEDYRSCV